MARNRTSEGRRDSALYRAAIYALLLTGVVPVLLPVYWLLTASLKSKERIAAYPPDWLPVAAKDFVTIQNQEVRVTVIDDGKLSRTGVARVKLAPGELLRLPRAQLEHATESDYFTPLRGARRRVTLRSTASSPAEVVDVIVPGINRTAVVAEDDLRTVTTMRTFWSMLGVEVLLTSDSGATLTISADPTRRIPLDPRLLTRSGERTLIRWRDRQIPVVVVEPDLGGGFCSAELASDAAAPDRPPLDELREEQRTTTLLRADSGERPVRVLDRNAQTRRAEVEWLDEPEVLSLPRAQLEINRRDIYRASVLGQTVVVEPVAPVSGEAAVIEVRVPAALLIAADRIRHEAPLRPQWTNYREAWREQAFDRYVVNTLYIAALVVLGTVLSCGLVGYAFARLEFRGRDALFLLLLATMMIPGQVTSIPTFVLFVKFGWIDTYNPLIVPSFLAASAFFVFLYRQYMLAIPSDLEDSARIDGCGPLATWWLIIMPLCKPIVVTVAVFTFIGVWNDFLGPLLYINSDEKQTVALGLQNFMTAFQAAEPQLIMAASVMMMLPTIALFFLAQKAFIRGVVVSGVKG